MSGNKIIKWPETPKDSHIAGLVVIYWLIIIIIQVNKLKRDLACMKQELQFKEQGFETLKG